MATNKVKFKSLSEALVNPIPKTFGSYFTSDPLAQAPEPEDFPEPAEQHPQSVYHLVLYTTKANINDEDKYTIYANEARSEETIQDRISAFKEFVDTQLAEGYITGFILKVYRISPFLSNTGMYMVCNYRKFEVKKEKVFLNGPLKNNEFLQKKGAHYA